MAAVILPHEVTEPVKAEMGALPNLGTIVVQDKGPGEDRVKNLVTEGVLHDLVLDAIRLDEPFLRLIDEKLIVSSGAVGSVPELFLEICNSLQRIGLTFATVLFHRFPFRAARYAAYRFEKS